MINSLQEDAIFDPLRRQLTPMVTARLGGLLPTIDANANDRLPQASPDRERLRAHFRGALIGGAIGDALGRPWEGSRRVWLDDLTRFSRFQRRLGYVSGPIGTVTDDTQMTMCVGATLLAYGYLDATDLARRFIDWLPTGRGRGATCVTACGALLSNGPESWFYAGQASAGNGAAMRAGPVGLRYAFEPRAISLAAALSAVVTHADGMAVASAAAQAFAVAFLVRNGARRLDAARFLRLAVEFISKIPDPGHKERRNPNGPPVTLAARLAELASIIELDPTDAFARLHNGAFVLESLPAAWYCFLRYPDDPKRCIQTAVAGGFDADTVAAMAATLAGAHNGESGFPDEWRGDELEFRDDLRAMADGLLALSST